MTWHQASADGHGDPCGGCGRRIGPDEPYARVTAGHLLRCVPCVRLLFGEEPPAELERAPVRASQPLPFASAGQLAQDWKAKQAKAE